MPFIVWDDFNNSLLNYLSNLFLTDPTRVVQMKIVQSANMPANMINWLLKPYPLWIETLEMAYSREKIIPLLEKVIEYLGEPEDEYLASALFTIKEKKKIQHKDLPKNDWKGGAYDKATKEKIMGKRSNLLPIGFLEAGTDASKSVVRIECGNELGTGFLISDSWLLTNNHVIPSKEVAQTANIQLGFQYPKEMRADDRILRDLKPELQITLDPGPDEAKKFFTEPTDDWTLVKISDQFVESLIPYHFLQLSDKEVRKGDFVNIIQHANGGPKQIGIYNNMVMYADENVIQYMTDTSEGSSGSPVMNSDWEVVALHHSGGWLQDPESNAAVRRNQGTNIQKIKKFITENKL